MENEITKMFGLLNLSKPILEDNVTGKLVSFKLNTSERNAILDGFNDKQMNDLIESANDYFRENEVVFYKNSRWTNSAVLHQLNVKEELARCQNLESLENAL